MSFIIKIQITFLFTLLLKAFLDQDITLPTIKRFIIKEQKITPQHINMLSNIFPTLEFFSGYRRSGENMTAVEQYMPQVKLIMPPEEYTIMSSRTINAQLCLSQTPWKMLFLLKKLTVSPDIYEMICCDMPILEKLPQTIEHIEIIGEDLSLVTIRSAYLLAEQFPKLLKITTRNSNSPSPIVNHFSILKENYRSVILDRCITAYQCNAKFLQTIKIEDLTKFYYRFEHLTFTPDACKMSGLMTKIQDFITHTKHLKKITFQAEINFKFEDLGIPDRIELTIQKH